MKKISILLLILCYLVLISPISAYSTEVETTEESIVSTEPVDQHNSAVNSGSYSLDALQPMIGSEKLSKNVKAAIVYESNSQTLLYAWNPDAQMYPASLVKIMTALVAIENASVDSLVTVNQSALDGLPADAMGADLSVNEVITLSDLLHCLLVGSANDAANVIAEHVGGNQNVFVQMMNDRAKQLGCTATYFTNPTGLHDDNQHTTARDIAKILDAAMKNEIFKEIFTKRDYLIPATNMSTERRITSSSSIQDNTSQLYYDSRVMGSRTGVTNDGRRCLAVAAESNGMSIVSIVMGAESIYQEDGYSAIRVGGYQETSLILDACLNGYKTAEIITENQTLRQIPVEGAKNHLVMGPNISLSTVLPEDMTSAGLTYQYVDKQLTLPIEKDQYVADVFIWNGNMCVGQAQLFAMNKVVAADLKTDDSDSEGNFTIGIVVLIISIVVAVVFLGIRYSGKIKLYIRKRKRMRSKQNRKKVRK